MDSDTHVRPAVGFIGLGAMGLPMARNILKYGYTVVVYDMVMDRVEAAVSSGAKKAESGRHVAEHADVVITILPAAGEVKAAILGPSGVIEGIRRGSALIEMSTIEAATIQEVAAALAIKGVEVLGAPVVRGVKGAAAGTLAVYAGGRRELIDRYRPLLSCMASDIIYCGEIGTGNTVKLVNNMIVGATVCLLSEALVLGVKAGVEPDALFDSLAVGSANSFVLQNHIKNHTLAGDFSEGMFSIDYEMKDLALALATADMHRFPLRFGALAYQTYQEARAAGLAKSFYPAVIKLAERVANVAVRTARPIFK